MGTYDCLCLFYHSFSLFLCVRCSSASDNSRLYQSCRLDEKERTKVLKDGGPYSGIFKIDFIRNCNLLGIIPHPQLIDKKKVRTVNEEEREEAEAAAAAAERQRKLSIESSNTNASTNTEQEQANSATATATAPVTNPAPLLSRASSPGSRRVGTAGGSKSTKPQSIEKLTPAQRAAQELANAMAGLTAEELKPITELNVRGWTLDVGTAGALQLTIPACKSLTTLRFWNANLNARALTLLSDSLKGSSVTKFYLDYNPLDISQGQEPSLIYSVLLAPNSPLQYVSLRGNRIDDTIASDLARTICMSKNLIVLDLFDNEIGNFGAEGFAKTLGLNSILQSLNLGNNLIENQGSIALAQTFQSINIVDKEDAKSLKKGGYKITTIKNRTMREANQTLKQLNLAQNYIGEEGLKAWVDMCAEQVKYQPSKGILTGTNDTLATSLIPTRLLPTTMVPSTTDDLSLEDLPKSPIVGGSSRKTPRRGGGSAAGSDAPTPIGSKPSSASTMSAAAHAAAAALAKKEKEDEEMRYPGQLNGLTFGSINLTKQSCKISELLWWQLRTSNLIRWCSTSNDTWSEEGTLDIRSLDALRREEEEKKAQQEAEGELMAELGEEQTNIDTTTTTTTSGVKEEEKKGKGKEGGSGSTTNSARKDRKSKTDG